MIDKIGDFYFAPKSEEEAREIIERAVAHGAKLHEAIPGVSGASEYWRYDYYECWAVFHGRTHTQFVSYYADQGIECLTIEQLRDRAPLVGELSDDELTLAQKSEYEPSVSVSKNQWQSARRALYFAGMLKPCEAKNECETPNKEQSAPDFLKSALGHMEDRAATYDAPGGERSMGKTVASFNAIYGTDLTE
jgi:hypothetical protein